MQPLKNMSKKEQSMNSAHPLGLSKGGLMLIVLALILINALLVAYVFYMKENAVVLNKKYSFIDVSRNMEVEESKFNFKF
jgi:hypothetical protein